MALTEPAKADAEEIGHLLRDPLRDNAFRDQSYMRPPPSRRAVSRVQDDPERKRARMMLKGTKSIQNLLKDRMEFLRRQRQSRKRVRMLPEPETMDPAAPGVGREALRGPDVPAIEDQVPPVRHSQLWGTTRAVSRRLTWRSNARRLHRHRKLLALRQDLREERESFRGGSLMLLVLRPV